MTEKIGRPHGVMFPPDYMSRAEMNEIVNRELRVMAAGKLAPSDLDDTELAEVVPLMVMLGWFITPSLVERAGRAIENGYDPSWARPASVMFPKEARS